MFWSTHPPTTIPNVGDIVTITNSGQPMTVARRSRNKAQQVMVLATPLSGPAQLLMVEVLNWWPQPGDICTGIPEPFRKWLTAKLDAAKATGNEDKVNQARYDFDDFNQLQSWFYGEFTVQSIKAGMATVVGDRFSGSRVLPVECITVVSRPSVAEILKRVEKDG